MKLWFVVLVAVVLCVCVVPPVEAGIDFNGIENRIYGCWGSPIGGCDTLVDGFDYQMGIFGVYDYDTPIAPVLLVNGVITGEYTPAQVSSIVDEYIERLWLAQQ